MYQVMKSVDEVMSVKVDGLLTYIFTNLFTYMHTYLHN
jgi:hypothetical protein